MLKGTGVRIALLTALLVMISLIVLGATAYSFVSTTMVQRIRTEIESETADLLDHSKPVSSASIAGEITHRIGLPGPRRYMYSLSTATGTQIVGDGWLKANKLGWHRLDLDDSRKDSDLSGDLLVRGTAVDGGNILSVARDIRWIAEVEDELFEILLWTLLLGLALAGVTAAIVNRLLAHRISAVSTTAAAIMNGDLSQRIPLTGAHDNFDRLAETLNAMLERLQGLMENLEQVSNDIAHDLRTPLSRLRQGLERAKRTANTNDEFSAAIDHAVAEADGLLSTFTSLLRIAQIEAGVSHAGMRECDLSELLQSVVEAYEPSASDAGHHLISHIEAGIRLNGDRDLLTQMFANLIENGLCHTPTGSRIVVSLARANGVIEASIADDGPGVPVEERDKIFRRFHRLERSRTTPGTGLGLSLVAAVTRLHGAEVEMRDNNPGLRLVILFKSMGPL